MDGLLLFYKECVNAEFVAKMREVIEQQKELGKELQANIEKVKRLSESYKCDTNSN